MQWKWAIFGGEKREFAPGWLLLHFWLAGRDWLGTWQKRGLNGQFWRGLLGCFWVWVGISLKTALKRSALEPEKEKGLQTCWKPSAVDEELFISNWNESSLSAYEISMMQLQVSPWWMGLMSGIWSRREIECFDLPPDLPAMSQSVSGKSNF